MSGFAGVFNRDGSPVEPQILDRITLSARHRGPDGINSWIDGAIGLSQLLMATTPEAIHEMHPFRDPASGAVIVFDGRVDNRDELVAALGVRVAESDVITDMELVLR